ncbi:stage V sporulation protein R [Bacillus thuringiensis serovar kurstaki str. YBT-1520]|nr:stage V sporulation protein R [Bacillus thuringiensis serovar kurstaki str. YBT-1520]
MRASDDKALQYAIAEITEIATGFGLDFYPMRYEICPAEIIIHLVHMGCRQGFHIGVLENNFSE